MKEKIAAPVIFAGLILAIQKALIQWRLYAKKRMAIQGRDQDNMVQSFFFERYNLLVMVPLALMIYGVIGEQLSEVIHN